MNVNELSTEWTPEQRKWVIARLKLTTDAAAARVAGVHPATVCRWPNKAELDAKVKELLNHPLEQAMTILTDAVPDAARVKVDGLKSRDERIRQAAASEILDRELGGTVQKIEAVVKVVGFDLNKL
jgi:hypothetical protein